MSNVADFALVLEALLNMPEYDGSAATSRERQKAKNAAKRLLKAYRDDKALRKGALTKPLKVK
jgi:hypothetical protein